MNKDASNRRNAHCAQGTLLHYVGAISKWGEARLNTHTRCGKCLLVCGRNSTMPPRLARVHCSY